MANLKLPPQNIEAEESVLGSLMIDKDAVVKVADFLSADDFYRPAHTKIYQAIISLYEKNQPIDILSLTAKLKEEKNLEEIGGSSYLSKLVSAVPTASHVGHYGKIVKEKRILRDLIGASAEITEQAMNPADDVDSVLDEIEKKIFSISQRSIAQNFIPIKDELHTAYERIEALHRGDGRLRGLPTGFNDLDNILSGLQKSDLIILGARPSLGKTSFTLDIARHIITKTKEPVGLFSLEMSREQVVDRLIASEAQVPLWKLRTGRLTSETDFELIQASLDSLSRAPLFIDDTPSPNILQMRAMARRLQANHGLSLIIIDYLQLIQPRTNSDNMVSQITEISRGLKGLARELKVPVLAVSQLSRAVDQREIKVPRLSDLRESGCLTGDAIIMRADTGELMSIQKLAERQRQEPIPVYALDENWNLKIAPLVKAFSSGKKPVFELKMRSGRTIKASANHPFRKLDNWQRLDELKAGDKIALPRELNALKPDNLLSDEELILLAHLIGDGCTVPRQPIHYTSGDFENILTVKDAARSLFNIQARIVKQKNWWHIYLPSPYRLTHGKHHPITNWLYRLGLGLRYSWQKELPEDIFNSDQNKIALFLKHLWSTDGNISWKILPGRELNASIYYGSTSRKLSQQVQHLLLRLAIQSTLITVPQIKGARKYRPMHYVAIQNAENQLSFLKKVGSHGNRGRIIPELIKTLEKIKVNHNLDVIPKEAWRLVIEPAKVHAGIGWRDVSTGINTAYSGTALFKNGIGRTRMLKLANFLNDKHVLNLAKSDIYWDEIVEIKPLGIEEVFDATVENYHNFIANDVIVHNSIEQDADVVLFIYRKDRDKMAVSAEEENVAEIIVAKHRNGPLGTVRLRFDPEKVTFQTIDKMHISENV